jgi:hypothetical protein
MRLIRLIRLICIPAFSAAFLSACGHNAIVFDKGFGFHAGVDPEHFSADVRFVYGEALTLATRDNVELELVSDVEGGQEQTAADVKTGSKLRIKIGRQINGAARDLVEAGASAEQIHEILASE